MQTIKTILLLLFILISQSIVAMKGYHKGDTIWYKLDKMLIEVATTQATRNDVPLRDHFDRIEQIQKILSELKIEEPGSDERITVSFKEMGDDMYVWNFKEVELTKTKRNTKTLIVFEDGTTFEKDYGKYCIYFSFKATETKVYLDNMDDLNLVFQDEFKTKTEQARKYLLNRFDEKYRKNIQGWLDLRGDQVKGHFQDISYKNNDMLILSAGIGSGWVKNIFVSDINFRVGVSFSKKGLFKNAYYLDWNMMYDFSDSNENKFYELNHFLSLTWDHNFSNTPLEDKWYGFSVGYLVKRNNDFFKDNTFRVAVNKKINNTFSVKPELYFNDFFKNVHPGIRVSVAF